MAVITCRDNAICSLDALGVSPLYSISFPGLFFLFQRRCVPLTFQPMRAIGEVGDRTAAEKFQEILYAQGINAEIEPGEKEGWLIWVKSDDDCPRAAEML